MVDLSAGNTAKPIWKMDDNTHKTVPFVGSAPLALTLFVALLTSASSRGAEPLVLVPVPQMDGYVVDVNGDGAGDAKVLGSKLQELPVGETNETTQARAWLPFVLTEDQKALMTKPNMSATLRLYLTGKNEVNGLRGDLYGSGYRSDLRVNQNDYGTLRKKIVANVFNADSATGAHEIDVTDFVREEAARPKTAGLGFGFLLQMHDETLLPKADGALNVFKVGSSSRTAESERPALVISSKPRVVKPTDPEPEDPQAVRVLIIGNSILKNGPIPAKGWAGNWGMAASAPKTDFAHLLMERIKEKLKRPVLFKLHNMAFWENTWPVIRHDVPLVTYARDFNPDIILSCISENSGLRDAQVDSYGTKYEDMISIIAGGTDGKRKANVIVRTSFWTINANTDLALSRVAERRGWPCVKCSDLGLVRANLAYEIDYKLGPEPVDDGVRAHPGDVGMKAIADRIWDKALSDLLVREYLR